MKNSIPFLVFVFLCTWISAQELKKEDQEKVQRFIDGVQHKDVEQLKNLVSFPLGRAYPLPDINNEVEFVNRYDEIFDEELTNEIIHSDLQKDWVAVGWRGIMLNRGTLWLDYDGKVLGLNHQSEVEQKRRTQLIAADRNSVHPILREFKEPVLLLETKKFRIRIDELENNTYRYASWSIHAEMQEKPDLILEKGSYIPDGTGGNHSYEFANGNYKYICAIHVLSVDEAPPASLSVYKNDKEILNQPAEMLKM